MVVTVKIQGHQTGASITIGLAQTIGIHGSERIARRHATTVALAARINMVLITVKNMLGPALIAGTHGSEKVARILVTTAKPSKQTVQL